MAGFRQSRQSASVLPSLLVAAAAAVLLSSLGSGSGSSSGFLHSQAASPARAGRVARHAFVDEFQEWRKSLTADEQAMLGRQSKYMFNKTYRGSDEFDQDIPDDKIEKIGTILSKYFESEAEEYKKERLSKKQDPNALFEKSGGQMLDMSLTNEIVPVNRRADREYYWQQLRTWEAEQKGEVFGVSDTAPTLVEAPANMASEAEVKEMIKNAKLNPKLTKLFEEQMAKGMPKPGDMIPIPETLNFMRITEEDRLQKAAKEDSSIDVEKELAQYMSEAATGWLQAVDRVTQDAETQKEFYNSMENKKGQTKADVIKAVWPELKKISKRPLPPLSEELLEDLAQQPAYEEHSFKNKFGTKDMLYKSEAVDPFGTKFLLGVFETKEEAKAAFDSWNKAYKESQDKQQEKIGQWWKRQQAKLAATQDAQDRVLAAAMAGS